MIIVVEFLEAEHGHSVALRTALLYLARTTLEQERGCRRFDIGQDDVDATAFLVYQIYDDRADYTLHLERSAYADHRILTEPWIKTRRILTYDHVSHGGSA